MPDLLHTISCPVPGFEALQITVNLGLTGTQITDGWQRGECRAIAGFPDWFETVKALGLPETLEPAIPLTIASVSDTFPVIVAAYLNGYDVINDALRDYMAEQRPFLKKRSVPI